VRVGSAKSAGSSAGSTLAGRRLLSGQARCWHDGDTSPGFSRSRRPTKLCGSVSTQSQGRRSIWDRGI